MGAAAVAVLPAPSSPCVGLSHIAGRACPAVSGPGSGSFGSDAKWAAVDPAAGGAKVKTAPPFPAPVPALSLLSKVPAPCEPSSKSVEA
jgi:hypothetical protein